MDPLRVGFVCSELTPLAKSGGLADVSAALPRYLARTGHDVRVFMPLYSSIDTSGLDLHNVDFLRDVPLDFGDRRYVFSALTTRLPGTDTGMYLIHCPALYDRDALYTHDDDEHLRFALLCRAAIECCQRMGWSPEVFHCNDWHTGLLPLYLKTVYGWDALFGGTKTLLTIHNLGYQGLFDAAVLPELGFRGHEHLFHNHDLAEARVSYLKSGILYADLLGTVSPTYAQEIQEERYGMGLHPLLQARSTSLVGILNGVDYEDWDPRTDPHIPVHYSENSLQGKGKNKRALLENLGLHYTRGVPVLGIVSRLTYQKGFELCFDVLPDVLARYDMRLAVLGSGEDEYESFFSGLQASYLGKVCFYRGYHERLAHMIEAGADMFLMPSRYEPCGLNQMYSLRYGTIPIVRKTGGLADTVQIYDPATGQGTGVVFEHFTAEGLRWGLETALELYGKRKAWRRLVRNAMAQNFSWERQGAEYVRLYRRLIGR
jgi:starch synthase